MHEKQIQRKKAEQEIVVTRRINKFFLHNRAQSDNPLDYTTYVPKGMVNMNMFPYAWVNTYCSNDNDFKGPNATALTKDTLQRLVDKGAIKEVPKDIKLKYGTRRKLYQLLDLQILS